ncbi:hypothetical protein C2845_PM04G07090 [Panicum miliaceum]|uniref:Uncharacterized protein n=1 Tax=Panicum miliaceum TaxID=4540 RepID=A0A3L6QME8_PANMI|nr:hypothetical protein C2845_PM04G07090 [Panicum miliaceum]
MAPISRRPARRRRQRPALLRAGAGHPAEPAPAVAREGRVLPGSWRSSRCRALRAMAEETPAAVVGRVCWLAQARFAPTVVAESECGLRTVHGVRFCDARGAEEDDG